MPQLTVSHEIAELLALNMALLSVLLGAGIITTARAQLVSETAKAALRQNGAFEDTPLIDAISSMIATGAPPSFIVQ
jgi:hypothetical protein